MHQEEMGRGWGAGAQLIGVLACVSLQGPGGGAAEVLSGLWAMLGVVTGRPSGPAEPCLGERGMGREEEASPP